MGQNEKANRQVFKSRAYFRAAKAIRDSKVPVTSGKAAQQLEGVGKKIALKIDEILATGVLMGPLYMHIAVKLKFKNNSLGRNGQIKNVAK